MALALFIFSVITYVGLGLHDPGRTMTVPDFIRKLYMERATYAYWYIYAYIALLMTLPNLLIILKTM